MFRNRRGKIKMKLIGYFENFIESEVELNKTRKETLDSHIEALEKVIKESEKIKYQGKEIQGSWSHGTIIKPVADNDEYDADVMITVDINSEYEPKDYLLELSRLFKGKELYKDKTTLKTRCVRITYSGDCHVDLVPRIKENNKWYIFNRQDDVKEITNPKELTEWIDEKNRIANFNLKKVIMLIKYLRDYKNTFSVKSVLLNTMIGNLIEENSEEQYPDIPTALKNIMSRLDDYLQANADMPIIHNPKCYEETFDRNWNQDIYSNFRNVIHNYTQKIEEAYNEEDKDKSIKLWQDIFGDEFGKYDTKKKEEVKNNVYNSKPYFK